MTVRPEEFRSHFPICAEKAYLASCSQGALSDRVTAAMAEHMTSWRERGAPWAEWTEEVERARRSFARLIHASPDEVAVLGNASEGAFQAASTLGYAERARIVSCEAEFPSIGHVWLAQRPRGAEVAYAPERDGVVRAEDYESLVDERTALVSAPLVSYRNGARLPLAEVTKRARDVGARVFVDAYQGAGVLPVDVREIDCDYLVAGSLKYLLGAPGIAFLYVRGGLSDAHEPLLTGWFGRRDPFSFDPRTLDFPAAARRFETGTPSVPAAYAAVAGMSLIAELDPAAVARHVAGLTERLTGELGEDGVQLYSPTDPRLRGPQVAVVSDGPGALATFLAERGVVASPRGRAVRLSVHYYTDDSDLERARAALRTYRDPRR